MPFINEAAYALMEGVAEAEAIDTIAKLGFAHPMGPLALADLIGLDTCVAIMEVLHRGLGDPKYAPCPLLRQYVQAGRLGRKSRPRVLRLLPSGVARRRAVEDVVVQRVHAVKSTAPFTSSTTQLAASAGSRSTPTRSPPIAAAAASATRTRRRRRRHRLAARAERDVRPPFTRGRDAAHRPDDASAARRRCAGRSRAGHELAARSRPSRRTTACVRQLGERGVDRRLVVAADDVARPTSRSAA